MRRRDDGRRIRPPHRREQLGPEAGRRLTRVQASDIRSYEPGDTIVFHRSVFGCLAGDVCMVTGAEDGHVALEGPDGSERRFRPSGNASTYLGLYDTERIEVRAGEHIRWTRNRKARPEYSTTMHFGRGSTRRASATAGTCSPTGTRSSRNWRRPAAQGGPAGGSPRPIQARRLASPSPAQRPS